MDDTVSLEVGLGQSGWSKLYMQFEPGGETLTAGALGEWKFRVKQHLRKILGDEEFGSVRFAEPKDLWYNGESQILAVIFSEATRAVEALRKRATKYREDRLRALQETMAEPENGEEDEEIEKALKEAANNRLREVPKPWHFGSVDLGNGRLVAVVGTPCQPHQRTDDKVSR
jgi:hypothetical protein